MKKRAVICVILLALALSCAAGEAPESVPAPVNSIAWYTIQTGCGRDPAELEPVHVTRDQETVDYYLTEVYGLEEGSWTDAAIYRAGGTEAFEIAVIRTESKKDTKAAVKALEGYIEAREADFTGYEPEQADIVHNAKAAFSDQGDAALLICDDPDQAAAALSHSYAALARTPFDPPGKDDMTLYDTSAILAAWDSGGAAGLSEKDAAILEAAEQVLEQTTGDGMTDLEREEALYRWLTANAVYDQDHYDPLGRIDPDSYNPCGPLSKGKGICVGFATAFQLLMDMAGVECITVVGAARNNVADHAWNMVRLDGKWYCVDVTWDLGHDTWSYFNVSSDWMAFKDHQWDYETVPETAIAGWSVGT